MSAYAIRPLAAANGGLTTAINATSGVASAKIACAAMEIIISVGAGAPICVRFGGENDTVTNANGLWLPANSMIRLSVPGATHLHHIRSAAADSTISVLLCDGGI